MSIVKKLSTELHSLADQIHNNVFSGEEKAVIANRLYEISKELEDFSLDAVEPDVLKTKKINDVTDPNVPLNENYTAEGPLGISGIPGPTGKQVLDDKSEIIKSDGNTAEPAAIAEQDTSDQGNTAEDESPL